VTTIAAHLALGAAELAGGPVLLVETRASAWGLPEVFGAQANPGLADWRRGSAELEVCLQEVLPERLTILTAGSGEEAIDGAEWASCVGELRDRFGAIVFDLGAANRPAFPDGLAALLDGLLLVIEAGRVTDREALRVKERLIAGGDRMLGAIWNEKPGASYLKRSR
jgi:Mrp family chromosome partitioning ATPase